MKVPLPSILLLLPLLAAPTVRAHDVSGVWETSRGIMVLNQKGGSITGSYATANGRITGQLKDNILDGYWTQESSARECPDPRDGTKSWGRVRLVFDTTTFTGNWSHCGEPPATETWTGQKPGTGTPAVDVSGKWKSSESTLTLAQQGNLVSGTYEKNSGQLRGALQGKVLEAIWVQTSSAQRCDRPRNGEYHWGRMRLTFDKHSFTGYFGYCDGPLKLPWSGER